MKLGIAPTFHLSYRLRFLSLRQFSSSYSSLIRLPISELHSCSNVPRLRLWQRSVATISSGDAAGDDKGVSDSPRNRRTTAYDLSSGFLQSSKRSQSSTASKFPQDDDDDDDGEDWENVLKIRGTDNSIDYRDRNAGIKVSTRSAVSSDSNNDSPSRSGGIRSGEEDFDDEIGGWMGSPEPSKSFQKSSLYNQRTDYDVKPQRSVRYSPFPQSSGNPSKPPRPKTKTAAKNQYQIYSDNRPFTPSKPASADDASSDFIPPVIKPEQPYIYSYSETPKVPPLGFREPVYSPFGPEGVNRPWTGRPPLAKSKKKPREFDSFNPPPVGKKGVKPVQQPGPFPEGEGPKLGRSREEIMGAPLIDAEVKELVMRAQKEDRQLNLGRDGLTHNMLNLVHEHWKRRRVCKIKCKGVPTVDMDNVCRVLEEKSGGKIIQRSGGVVYLFRGRNYNYKTRPIIPLMLWKPPAPIYPKLIEKAPAGLTVEEANELRKLGRKLPPICHLGKNGVYLNLVRDVQIAFRADDLVKVDCHNMNATDFKKIGAKLRDLVPCVLLSFERENILMWKGPKSEVGSPDGVQEDNSGETVPPFRRELPEDGRELLEQVLISEDGDTLGSAVNSDIQEVEEGETLDFAADSSIQEAEDSDEFDDDTGTDESSTEVDHDLEAAYEQDSEPESILGEVEDAEIKARYEASAPESSVPLQDTGLAPFAGIDEDKEAGAVSSGGQSDEKVEEAVREFESLWEEAKDSDDVLILDEDEVNPDAVFEVVKSHFGGPYGAPAKPRNKRNSNELVGKKALKNLKPRLDPSVLDRVPKDPSGLLEIDELAKLLAP